MIVDEETRGTLTYSIYLDGALLAPDGTYVVEDVARLRVVLRLSSDTRRWRSRLRVGIGPRALRSLDGQVWRPVSTRAQIIEPGAAATTLTFESARVGVANLVLPFVALDKSAPGWREPAGWVTTHPDHLIVAPQVILEGARTPEELAWSQVGGRLPGLVGHVRAFGRGGKYYATAVEAIAAIVERDFGQYASPGSSRASVDAFVEKYRVYEDEGFAVVDERLRAARAYAAGLSASSDAESAVVIPETPARRAPVRSPTPAPLPGAESTADAAWRAAVDSRDTARLRDYLRTYAGVIPRYDTAARDSIACWPEPSYRVLDRRGARERIQLVNFTQPAYYDVYGAWVDIDDRQLMEQQLLSLEIKRSDRLALRIVDKACPRKEVVIPVDNIMSAELTTDTVGGTYAFRFRGGSPPYRLRLSAVGPGAEGEWLRAGITGERYVVTEDSLRDAGLGGYYEAEAYSEGSDAGVPVDGTVYVAAAPTPDWVWPTLLVFALGGLALLVLFVLRQGRSAQRTVFEE